MRPAGQNDKSPCSSICNNMVTDENKNEVAGTGNSDGHPGGGNMSDLQLQGGVVGLHRSECRQRLQLRQRLMSMKGGVPDRLCRDGVPGRC